jgi:D-alanyl-D-alanine carboxypeptidase
MVGEPKINENVINNQISVGTDNVKVFSPNETKEGGFVSKKDEDEMKQQIKESKMLNEEHRLAAVSKLSHMHFEDLAYTPSPCNIPYASC